MFVYANPTSGSKAASRMAKSGIGQKVQPRVGTAATAKQGLGQKIRRIGSAVKTKLGL